MKCPNIVTGLPVLLSGLSALVLKNSELESLDHHYKVSLERFQRLYRATPAPVVYFLAGSLPASALLHLRQLSLLSRITRLGQGNILHQHGRQVQIFLVSFCQRNMPSVFPPDPLETPTYPPELHSYRQVAGFQTEGTGLLEHQA